MKLVIVESPTKANTIGKFIGKDYKVESSFGHVRDLPKSLQRKKDVPPTEIVAGIAPDFTPRYIIPAKARARVKELRQLAHKAKEIILASDEDREGEAIAWHLLQVLEGKGSKTKRDSLSVIENKPVQRIVFHEITEEAIKHALESPRQIDQKMVEAQQARRLLDRLVGFKLSPFLWKKIAPGLSAGRVQSVALRLIVDRENEIRAFKPEEYWSISALLKKGAAPIEADLIKVDGKTLEKFDIKTKADADAVVAALEKGSYAVASVKKTETRKNPSGPFTTSTLQQTASTRLGYSAKKTMTLAQMLYENGHITYMRTDSLNLSKQSQAMAADYLTQTFGERYVDVKSFHTKSKGAQEAHEAIRPTKLTHPDELSVSDEGVRKLYRLIWQRFVASQMPAAVFDATSIDIEATPSASYKLPANSYILRTNGNTMKFDGFLKIYPQSVEEKELPQLAEGDSLKLDKIVPAQHFTEPPPRYSEAKLIKTLEEYGIGRPSTYVSIISVIQARNYVKKEGGRFFPTEIGEMVSKLLTEHFPQVVDIGFTAKIEKELDEVAEGEIKWQEPLHEFYDPFVKLLAEKYESVAKENPDEMTDEKCDCKGNANNPDSKCTHEGLCGKPMVIKFGRFGKFLACSGFPDCKNAKNVNRTEPLSIGMKCPKCSTGDIVVKQSRKGRKKQFWGCNRYPNCDWASWDDPTKTPEEIKALKEKEKAEREEKKLKKVTTDEE
jgi:DNA topoisomerase I